MQNGNGRPKVREERTHWRDLALNDRHRTWGWDCPCVDIDLLFIEYDHSKPIAIVEYKHENARTLNPGHSSIRAIVNLCDRAEILAFTARYSDDFSCWEATSLNGLAKAVLPRPAVMTEREWVSFLYKLRGRAVPNALFDTEGT